jgi:hypothetical protein
VHADAAVYPTTRPDARPPRLVLAALVGCREPTAPLRDRSLATHAADAGIMVSNASPVPIHHFVVGRSRAALILWGPCTGGDWCPTIPARGQAMLPWPAGDLDPRETEYLFHWRRAVSDGAGGLRADSIRVGVLRR